MINLKELTARQEKLIRSTKIAQGLTGLINITQNLDSCDSYVVYLNDIEGTSMKRGDKERFYMINSITVSNEDEYYTQISGQLNIECGELDKDGDSTAYMTVNEDIVNLIKEIQDDEFSKEGILIGLPSHKYRSQEIEYERAIFFKGLENIINLDNISINQLIGLE